MEDGSRASTPIPTVARATAPHTALGAFLRKMTAASSGVKTTYRLAMNPFVAASVLLSPMDWSSCPAAKRTPRMAPLVMVRMSVRQALGKRIPKAAAARAKRQASRFSGLMWA